MGAGAGPGRWGGTCLFLHKNVLRNRLECSFGAVCKGQKRCSSLNFPQKVHDFALDVQDFSPGKISQNQGEN